MHSEDGIDTDDEVDTQLEVSIAQLSVYTHHGVSDAEQTVGQRLEFDLTLHVGSPDAIVTDRLDDTIDYAEVCDIVVLAATERRYRTLERLASVVAERLMERFGASHVTVRATKPEPPLPLSVASVSVEVERFRDVDDVDEE